MKLTPPVLIFESIPMDLGDLGGRAGGRTDAHGRGRTPWPSVHGATQLAHFGMLRRPPHSGVSTSIMCLG